MAWILVVNPPLERPMAWQTPFFSRPCAMLMGADDGEVEAGELAALIRVENSRAREGMIEMQFVEAMKRSGSRPSPPGSW